MNYYWFNVKKFCKKQKKNILKNKLLSIINRTKKLYKKSQESVIKTCHKKKKTILENIKEKNNKNWFNIKSKL